MMKKQRLREKTLVDVKKSKQSTFDRLPEQKAIQLTPKIEKSIIIAQLGHVIKEDELELSIAFRLLPSKNSFSNVMLELYFDSNKINAHLISVPPSQLLGDELEFPITLDMKGIHPGPHTIKVEMYERWNTGEKLTNASKYLLVQYSPTRKEDRYIKVPIVKKINGAFRIILPEEKELYRELEKSQHQDLNSKRDQW
jgi:hypothetical protein